MYFDFTVGGTVKFADIPGTLLNQLNWSPPFPPQGIILFYNARITSGGEYVRFVEKIKSHSIDLRQYTANGLFYVEVLL